MATYYVWSGAAGTNAGTSWTNAYTAFASAVTAATADNDVILVHYTHREELAADTTYTFGANYIRVVSVNKDSSDAPTEMGTGGWIGNSTTNRSVTMAGARIVYVWGVTLRTAGGTLDNIALIGTSGQRISYENCYFWNGNTNGSSGIALGSAIRAKVTCINCTFRFGQASQAIYCGAIAEIIGGSVSSAGTAPTVLFRHNVATGANVLTASGFDMSFATGTLVADANGSTVTLQYVFERCKLGAGVVPLAAQTAYHGVNVSLFDCSSGDTHGIFGYYDQYGSVVSDTGITYTGGAAGQSWKIVTTAIASVGVPFCTPWLNWYHAGTSSITPRLEILRDSSTTAYDDDEVWAEFSAKVTSGTVLPTLYTDRMAVLGTPAAQANGAGLGSWTGESGTAWSGKVDSGSALTPAETGYLSGRVCVGLPSATVYVDPQIRT